MTYTLTQFWFNLYASYSGQRLYDDWYQAFYNLLFTSLPVIVVGLLDQDVSKVPPLGGFQGLECKGLRVETLKPRFRVGESADDVSAITSALRP